MNNPPQLPALRLLLQGYLNLDWPDDYPDPWSAVEAFASREPVHADALVGEIRAVLADATEDDLNHLLLLELDSGYLPAADGWDLRAWLEQVAEHVENSRRGGRS